MRSLTLIILLASLGGCARPAGEPPSLQPRPAEAIDPRVPIAGAVNDRPVTPALSARLAILVDQAEAGAGAFDVAAGRAEQLAAAAGGRDSESWKVAQEALSAAIAARAPVTRSLADIDALASDALQAQGGMSPADLAAVRAAADRVSSLDSRQASRIEALQRRLGS